VSEVVEFVENTRGIRGGLTGSINPLPINIDGGGQVCFKLSVGDEGKYRIRKQGEGAV